MVKHIPAFTIYSGALPCRYRLSGIDQPDVHSSHDKLELISGWRPNITLQESIARMTQAAPLAVDSGDPR
jgi:hypothetical protein